MKKVILITVLFSLSLAYLSAADESNMCNTCSLIDEEYIAVSSDKVYTTEEEVDTEIPTRMVNSKIDTGNAVIQKNDKPDFEDVLFRSQINRLDEILKQYKNNEDGIFATTKNIDLLSGFRRGENGRDVIVPLGFFVYLNKKF